MSEKKQARQHFGPSCPPYAPQHWTRSPHWGGPSPKGGAGCPSVASCPSASEPASWAGSPPSVRGPLRHQNLHEQPARSSPPVLTPDHGPARPSSGESAWKRWWKKRKQEACVTQRMMTRQAMTDRDQQCPLVCIQASVCVQRDTT